MAEDGPTSRLDKINSCISWIKNNYPHFIHQSLQVVVKTDGRCGWINASEKNIPSKSVLISLPFEVVLSPQHPYLDKTILSGGDKTLREIMNKIRKKFLKEYDANVQFAYEYTHAQLIVLVMHVCSKVSHKNSDADFLKAYAPTWPSDVSNFPLHWKNETNSYLKGTQAEAAFGTLRVQLDELFHKIIKPVIKSLKPQSQKDFKLGKLTLEKTFKYAATIQNSTSHIGSQMTPLIDFINGMPENHPTLNVEIESGKNLFRRSKGPPSTMTIKSTKRIKPHEELLISYGEINTGGFLWKYGFVPPELVLWPNLYDEVNFGPSLDMLPEKKDHLRWKLLNAAGYTLENMAIHPVWNFGVAVPFPLRRRDLDSFQCFFTGNPEAIAQARQLTVLLSGNEESVKHSLETGRVRSSLFKPASYCSMIDFQLARFSASLRSCSEDFVLCISGIVRGNEANAILCSIAERELFYEWRHAICEKYKLYDKTPSFRPIFPICEYCGRTMNLRKCKYCPNVFYCSSRHQKADSKRHRRYCTRLVTWNDVIKSVAKVALLYCFFLLFLKDKTPVKE